MVDTTLRALAAGANVTLSVANNVVTISAQGQTGATGPEGLRDPLEVKVRPALLAPQERKDPRVQKATQGSRGLQEHRASQACRDLQDPQDYQVYPGCQERREIRVIRVIPGRRRM